MNLSNIIGSGFIAKSFKKKNNFFKKNKYILEAPKTLLLKDNLSRLLCVAQTI